jgi:hypothetical protein
MATDWPAAPCSRIKNIAVRPNTIAKAICINRMRGIAVALVQDEHLNHTDGAALRVDLCQPAARRGLADA